MNEKILEIAEECGALVDHKVKSVDGYAEFSPAELTCFALRMKQEALLEAAKIADDYAEEAPDCGAVADELRRMAELLGKGE